MARKASEAAGQYCRVCNQPKAASEECKNCSDRGTNRVRSDRMRYTNHRPGGVGRR